MRRAAAAVAAAAIAALTAMAPAQAQMLDVSRLHGRKSDDHAAALAAFRETCALIDDPAWRAPCRCAADADPSQAAARAFFELLFRPVVIARPPALLTGYQETERDGSLTRSARFRVPLHACPPGLADGAPYFTRAEIGSGALRGRGLEIAWLADPVEACFLQVQGSGRIRLPDGHVLLLCYAGWNGHPCRSIGQEPLRLGTLLFAEVPAGRIRAWVRADPAEGRALLQTDPSCVSFGHLSDLPPDRGPLGAMGGSLTPLRSTAVAPARVPLGAPVRIETYGAEPLRRLMMAQDTGGAIGGPRRAAIFFGTGSAAGDAAGGVKDGGRLVALLSIDLAFAPAADG